MCIDCPTRKDTAKAVGRELAADLILPLFLYALPIGMLIVTGVVRL